MDFSIPEELEKARRETREFAKNELEPYVEGMESKDEMPPHIVELMKRKGYFGLIVPKEYGGGGISKLGFSLIQEELCRVHISFCDMMSTTNGCARSIVFGGNEDQKRKYLPSLAKGETLSSFALTEPNAGSDTANLSTHAEKIGNGYVLNGLKHFITNAPRANMFIVMAVTDPKLRGRGGITAFIVPKETPGVSIGSIHQTMGIRGLHKSEVLFKDASVPAENVLGETGQGLTLALKTVDDARLGAAAMSIGMADRLLELSMDYTRETFRLGRPLSETQAIQWLLADMGTELYAARLMLYHAATQRDRGKRIRLEAAMCKAFASEMISRTVERALEIFGKEGCLGGSTVERICRDARVLRIFDGTSEIQRNVIGRTMLKGEKPLAGEAQA